MREAGAIVSKYRNKRIDGVCISLVPLSEDELPALVELRNKPRSMYYLNQQHTITLEDQKAWYAGYLDRDNDMYWSVHDENDGFIGVVRIYDIDPDKDTCEHGSFIIAEEATGGAPYGVEAFMLSLDFAFYTLGASNVVNDTRIDNKNMNNLSRKTGFKLIKDNVINGVHYNLCNLTAKDYEKNRLRLAKAIDYWKNR